MIVHSSNQTERQHTFMREDLGTTLQTLEHGDTNWKGKDLFLLDPTVSIFV